MRYLTVAGALIALLAVAPSPASAGISATGTPEICVFQQHWETVGGGEPFINIDTGTCWVDLTWSITRDSCPEGPTGQDGRTGTGHTFEKDYYLPAIDESLAQTWSQPVGGTWTGGSRIGFGGDYDDLFTEVHGEKLVGHGQWKIGAINCSYGGGPVETPWKSVPIYVRGPDYKPPSGGGNPSPPGPKPCPTADQLNVASRSWNTQASQMTGRAIEANAEVIRLAEEARDAFVASLGLDDLVNPATRAGNKQLDATIDELGRMTEIAARKRVHTADMDRAEVLTLLRLKKHLERFKAADKFVKRLALVKGLYLLGVAAQKGVERDSYRKLAKQALARSEALREEAAAAFQRCQTASAARQAPLAAPKRPATLELRSGLPRGARNTLNALLAGEADANALQAAIATTLQRAAEGDTARQLAHARTLAGRLAGRLEAQARLRERRLPAGLRANVRLTVDDGLASAMRKVDLPAPVTQLLKLLRVDATPFERGWRAVPAGGELVSRSLADPAAAARDRARAAEWRAFAAL
jgi:hypothetical protein